MIDLLRRVLGDVESLRARYALVGGHAVSVRTEPRFTRDLEAWFERLRSELAP